ncbi:hypothetical protein [Aquamicrobium sp. LC103]|uniref:hypothetical protein n=1 Tax=Aquamicrobium sp. LC103 TaxID=1120658 RepID=UPI000699857B|nr:hypothetical protein [Aquamicrobium sp. LC103]TKT79958.1 hypothetical protein XW59_006240 [Aquamicrobium sp. LC103]
MVQAFYNIGTATVAANGTAVTGQGTQWQQSVRPGDLFGTHKGTGIRIASVNSNTSLTLAYAWTGSAQTAAAYEIQFTPYDAGYQAAIEQLISMIGSGNNAALGALVGAANRLPFFTGAGTMDTTALTPFMRTLLDDANQADARGTLGAAPTASPTFTTRADFAGGPAGLEIVSGAATPAKHTLRYGTGNLVLSAAPGGNLYFNFDSGNDVLIGPQGRAAYHRGNVLGAVGQSGGVPTGAIIDRGSNANGEFVRFADGTQITFRQVIYSTTITTAVGNGFWASDVVHAPFAASFVAAPIVQVTALRPAGCPYGTYASPNIPTTSSMSISIVSVSSIGAAFEHPVNVVAVGRWF